MLYLQIIYCVVSLVLIFALHKNSYKLGLIMQQKYIRESERLFGDGSNWQKPWKRKRGQSPLISKSIIPRGSAPG